MGSLPVMFAVKPFTLPDKSVVPFRVLRQVDGLQPATLEVQNLTRDSIEVSANGKFSVKISTPILTAANKIQCAPVDAVAVVVQFPQDRYAHVLAATKAPNAPLQFCTEAGSNLGQFVTMPKAS